MSVPYEHRAVLKRALRIAKWPAGVGFFIGISGAIGIKSATLLGKTMLAITIGPAIALALGLPTFAVAYLILILRAR